MAEQDFITQQESQKKNDKADSPFQTVSKNVTVVGSRLRVLEERYSNIRKKNQMMDQNVLEFERDIRQEIRLLNQDLLDIKRSIGEINDNLIQMSSELSKSVKQSDFKVIEKYVDMWEPMSFVTRDELSKILKNK
ncbi:MAG: hypothetical protein KKF89_00345 [Nanoarchaeota archaeon]|nr:hypothetical protein [Patescibacteria group bacterium]MBU1854145.1 hypothetical protein [Nanoarchaeota archaeon]